MDSESSQNNVNSDENATTTTTSDTTTNDEHKQQSTEPSESSTDQSNIVDLIGNGQLVKKASAYLKCSKSLSFISFCHMDWCIR